MRYFYILKESPSSYPLSKIPFTWEPHKDNTCKNTKDDRGRPNKKRKQVHLEKGSDTESGEGAEDESKKDSCNMFCCLSENLHHLDRELAVVLCRNICSQFGLLFIDPEDMLLSVKAMDRQLVLQLVEAIFPLRGSN